MIETTGSDELTLLREARQGVEDAFGRLVGRYRNELLVHSYRILGSLDDAEDTLQEALQRAWRKLDTFEQRSSLRAWLYKIVTNAALDGLRGRRGRVLPTQVGGPAHPDDPMPGPSTEFPWLQPLPDTLVDERPAFNPVARYESSESVSLAFLTALQQLPGRQRAVLILRDVLGWHASEVAELLDTSLDSVNSALRRARATIKSYQDSHALDVTISWPPGPETEALLARYMAAWEASDSAALVSLLHDDAVATMPPLPIWIRGAEDIQRFLDRWVFSDQGPGSLRVVRTRANAAPAFAVYTLGDDGVYRPNALQVLTIVDGKIVRIDDFLWGEPAEFARFGLPAAL